jgi:DNA (cytosine-5)-methyltransferase 1
LRVVILATNGPQSPAQILLSGLSGDDIADRILPIESRHDYGFYWTEGKRGIGWAIDSVPTIKGGSGLGIPSPPAVFSTRHNLAGTISIEDAERMQGFPAGWTDVDQAKKVGDRWRLVGNAVSVPLSEWVASRINTTYGYGETPLEGEVFNHSGAIPRAAYVENGKWISVNASSIIGKDSFVPLREFLQFPLKPLSVRALSGYLSRAHQGERKFPEGFLDALSLQRDETPESGFSPFIL